jgi:uncharacterized Fe-S cluster protein YjdI
VAGDIPSGNVRDYRGIWKKCHRYMEVVQGVIYRALIGVVAGLATAQLAWWVNDREPPTEFHRVEAIPYDVVEGDEVLIHFKVLRHKNCGLKSERIIYDSIRKRWILPDLSLEKSPGPVGEDNYITPIELPPKMATGKASYVYINSYFCNPLHYVWPVVVGPLTVGFNVLSRG